MSHKYLVYTTFSLLTSIALSACGGIVESPHPAPGQDGQEDPSAAPTVAPTTSAAPVLPSCIDKCQEGFQCGASGLCELAQDRLWTIRVKNATLTTPGPDLRACLTIGGEKACAPVLRGSPAPHWNFDLPSATAATIRLGVKLELAEADEGGASGDEICAGNLDVKPTDFAEGKFMVLCGRSAIFFSISPATTSL